MDYWDKVMQADVYLVVTEGWSAGKQIRRAEKVLKTRVFPKGKGERSEQIRRDADPYALRRSHSDSSPSLQASLDRVGSSATLQASQDKAELRGGPTPLTTVD